MRATLVMFTQSGEKREFKVKREKTTIGRNRECDIQIPLGVVSRRHCELEIEGDIVTLRDLGSSNGTYLNNRRVQEVEISAGDTVTVGPVIFTLVVDGEPAEIKPVKTVIEGSKGKKKPDSDERPSKKAEETGSIDLNASAELELLADEDSNESDETGNPLSELEELSKPKKGGE